VANHFSVVRNRFKDRMGQDLVLLTVTFDPARDTPDRLAQYASQWKADSKAWHFLTGAAPDVERVELHHDLIAAGPPRLVRNLPIAIRSNARGPPARPAVIPLPILKECSTRLVNQSS
jgi:protein SCO1/2